MDVYSHPGKGLSLTQLVFALNEELRRTVSSSLFTPSDVSQLDRDISTALCAVREWRNSFARVNRIPLDILSLIPTHFSSQRDIFHASSVCRHWRRVFLQQGSLWARLFFKYGDDYITTLLERAKGSALEIVTTSRVPLSTFALLSPHLQRIEHLKFPSNSWTDILRFSESTSGRLPLLRTLEICHDEPYLPDHDDTLASLPLFSGATNLEEFTFHPEWVGSLDDFVFPNLTTFKLLTPETEGFDPSHLFGFLKASPMLRTVELEIRGDMMLGNVPQETVVVLPNVETFSLAVGEGSWHSCELVTRISCPRAKYTSFKREICEDDMTSNSKLFPGPIFWETVAPHCTTSQVEDVTLEIEWNRLNPIFTCSLTFQSSDATVIRLGVDVFSADAEEGRSDTSYQEMRFEFFSQACRTIQGHPLLSHVKRLHIKDRTRLPCSAYLQRMAWVVVELLGSLGPLDELTIHGCDLEIFLFPYIGSLDYCQLGRVFPPIKELTISDVFMSSEQKCMDGLTELAKEQHRLGKPFEHLTVRVWGFPTTMTERLREWVGAVDVEMKYGGY